VEIVATEVLDDNQGVVVAAVAEPVNCVVAPIHTEFVPVIVGTAFTVTVAVTEQLATLVYVIVVVPVAIAVTIPVLDIVATPVLEETHGLVVAAVPDPVNWIVDPIHTGELPVIVGLALIVTGVTTTQPTLFVYVIFAVPAATPVNIPLVEFILAMD